MIGAALSGEKYSVYPEYKESGVEWLGELPSNWIAAKLKFKCNIKGRIGFRGYTVNDLVDKKDGALVIGAGEIGNNLNLKLSNAQFISWEKYYESPEIMLKENMVLFVQRGSVGKVALVPPNLGKATINPSMVVLREVALCSKFLSYSLLSPYIQNIVKMQTSSTAIPMISQEQVGNYYIPAPVFKEQQKIANFLDLETAKIDTLIGKQEKLIELLKEKRQAVISHAVTRGLNPNAPIKDSGVESLGEVPEHWVVKQLKHCFTLQRGHDLASTQFKKGKYPVYGSNGVIGHHAEFTTYAPSITVGRSGSVGEVNFISENYWAHNTSLYLKNYNNSDVKYIYYFLLSMDLKSLAAGSAVGSLDRNNIHCRKIAVPDIDEQKEIAEYLEKQLAKFDLMNQKSLKGISLLKERKTALISAAVTGKIDVRNWQSQ